MWQCAHLMAVECFRPDSERGNRSQRVCADSWSRWRRSARLEIIEGRVGVATLFAGFMAAFTVWFLSQTAFVIGSVCLYCLVIGTMVLLINLSWVGLGFVVAAMMVVDSRSERTKPSS